MWTNRDIEPSATDSDHVEDVLNHVRQLVDSLASKLQQSDLLGLMEAARAPRTDDDGKPLPGSISSTVELSDGLCEIVQNWGFERDEWLQLLKELSEHVLQADEIVNAQITTLRETNARLEDEVAHRELAEARLRFTADYDRLTNLPNRHVLIERLEQCIARRQRNQQFVDAVLFLDLDNFKVINDSLGHSAGDELLVLIAERINQHRRQYDVVAAGRDMMASRLGGDEFVILLEELGSPHDAVIVAERLNGLMREPFVVSGREVVVSSSIGVAIVDGRSVSAEDLLRNADAAMYQAKFSGKNRFALFDKEMHANAISRLELERNLRIAVQNQEFELNFQPIVALGPMRTEGFEALIRWRRDGELVPPGAFIDVAEETGLIVSIGRWVIEQACETLRDWNQRDPDGPRLAISVNVSKRQFLEESFTADVRQLVEDAGIDHRQLQVEVTESLVMDDPEVITAKLHELREYGIRIHMDDFGTGHSSLSCLHKFPIDVLKIDRSFIATMGANSDYAAIVEAIIVLAHNLGTEVVAEGIETSEQLAQLVALGCDYGQGYLFSKPVPLSELSGPNQSLLTFPGVTASPVPGQV